MSGNEAMDRNKEDLKRIFSTAGSYQHDIPHAEWYIGSRSTARSRKERGAGRATTLSGLDSISSRQTLFIGDAKFSDTTRLRTAPSHAFTQAHCVPVPPLLLQGADSVSIRATARGSWSQLGRRVAHRQPSMGCLRCVCLLQCRSVALCSD